MQKDKAIFFGLLGTVLICLILYIVFSFGKKKDQINYKEEFQAPNLQETKQAYNSRIDALTKHKYDDEDKANPLRYNFMSDSEEVKVEINKNESAKRKEIHVDKKETKHSSVETREVVVQEPVNKEEPYQSGGFGIYTNQNKKVETPAREIPSGKYYKAYLEQDTKIVNGRNVVFILSEDAQIDGNVFKKNSVLYGKAVDRGDFFDISIDNILSTDGNATNQSGIYVFNEYYDRGIDHVGKFNEAVKEGAGKTAYDETGNLTGTRVERGADIALSVVDNTVKSLKGKKEISTDLYQGYVIYIKKVKQ